MPSPRFRDEPATNPKTLRFPAISATLAAKPRATKPEQPLSDADLVAVDKVLDNLDDLTREQKARAKERLWRPFLDRMKAERRDGV
jgi:hypothetical protein